MSSKEHAYSKALRQSITAAAAPGSAKGKLDALARIVSRAFDAGAAIALLDATGTHLIHAAHWRLPPFFVQKGLLDARKSINEISTDSPVLIEDTSTDTRLQYPDKAANAGIVSILGMAVMSAGKPAGVIRVYFKKPFSVNSQDASFIKSIATLAGIVLSPQPGSERLLQSAVIPEAKGVWKTKFAHTSEEEFARILDFYGVPWVYEPRSFPIGQKSSGTPEMFTPDFYLPGLDLYVELTTMKQSLVTQKNRKMRRLKSLYPGIKINLLYKNDYEKLLAKYGVGPLAESRAHGVSRILYSAAEIDRRVKEIAGQISADYEGRRPILLGVQRGFLCFMADLIRQISVPMDLDFIAISYYSGAEESGVRVTKEADLNLRGRHILLVEDIVDTGITLDYILKYLRGKEPASLGVCTLLDRKARRLVDTPLAYVGFDVPDEFVIGYGLDYHEEYRNLPFIAVPEIKPPDQSSKAKL